ncbi:hypothetical protein Msil_3918 [Methylocella silvestris BL2]|uniref:Peptidase M10 metallopeptidase domain-containing protein n=1 Tax=Methylocella silvestris (strain DSM 15510 / CIP 108128 / LMG 27833 / NCIMB 13906 / BL2) TaxID=395965 RepID=B8EMX0_METSB|nr:hypothetical protein [Methylocella silvestris]ACK52799.1 hypothetical protein Msil_3918 [Methylocella silvestris BL2]
MPTPWPDYVKTTKRLTIFPTSSVTSGPWGKVFSKAIAEFNTLSANNSLGVTFALGSSAPDPSGVGGADVQFSTINGAVQFTCLDHQFSYTLAGTALQGHTSVVKSGFDASSMKVAKAFICVPATPTNSLRRIMGDPAKLVLAAHELIHACGLDDTDHTSFAAADLFFYPLQDNPGSTPSGDTLTPFGKSTPAMPPLVLSSDTIKLIQTNWK